jgi:hypothetical protein
MVLHGGGEQSDAADNRCAAERCSNDSVALSHSISPLHLWLLRCRAIWVMTISYPERRVRANGQ